MSSLLFLILFDYSLFFWVYPRVCQFCLCLKLQLLVLNFLYCFFILYFIYFCSNLYCFLPSANLGLGLLLGSQLGLQMTVCYQGCRTAPRPWQSSTGAKFQGDEDPYLGPQSESRPLGHMPTFSKESSLVMGSTRVFQPPTWIPNLPQRDFCP